MLPVNIHAFPRWDRIRLNGLTVRIWESFSCSDLCASSNDDLVVIISVTIRGRPHIFGEAESALALASLVLKTVWYLGAALVNSFSPRFMCPELRCLVV